MMRLLNLGRRHLGSAFAGGVAAVCACSRASAQHPSLEPRPRGPAASGAPRSARSHMLDAGAAMLQEKAPLDAMNQYLNGFHFYADDMARPVEAHHFCTHLTEDLHQCVIFDANHRQARLIGIEYIISARLFAQLPDDEKRLWHSHHFETTSGLLAMPGVPDGVETAAMRSLADTYGKTWHTWQIDRGDPVPMGVPQLMMSFTQAGQFDDNLVRQRDQNLRTGTEQRARARRDIPVPAPAPGANAWLTGQTPQLVVQTVPVRNRRQ